jgi:hypothetical protein
VTDPSGTTKYTYVTAQTGPTAFAVESITYPDGSHAYFKHDDQGRLKTQYADDGTPNGTQRVTYAYDGEGGTRVIRRGGPAVGPDR